MAHYSITEAKTLLEKLVDKALAGEEIIITRYKKPMLRMEPLCTPIDKAAPDDQMKKST